MMRRAWCKFCLWLVLNWPFNAAGWSFKGYLFFLPWAGEEAYRDDILDAIHGVPRE